MANTEANLGKIFCLHFRSKHIELILGWKYKNRLRVYMTTRTSLQKRERWKAEQGTVAISIGVDQNHHLEIYNIAINHEFRESTSGFIGEYFSVPFCSEVNYFFVKLQKKKNMFCGINKPYMSHSAFFCQKLNFFAKQLQNFPLWSRLKTGTRTFWNLKCPLPFFCTSGFILFQLFFAGSFCSLNKSLKANTQEHFWPFVKIYLS